MCVPSLRGWFRPCKKRKRVRKFPFAPPPSYSFSRSSRSHCRSIDERTLTKWSLTRKKLPRRRSVRPDRSPPGKFDSIIYKYNCLTLARSLSLLFIYPFSYRKTRRHAAPSTKYLIRNLFPFLSCILTHALFFSHTFSLYMWCVRV